MKSAYIRVSEIAQLAGVSIRTAREWCRTGKLKSYKLGGKDHLVKREDFEAFMEGRVKA